LTGGGPSSRLAWEATNGRIACITLGPSGSIANEGVWMLALAAKIQRLRRANRFLRRASPCAHKKQGSPDLGRANQGLGPLAGISSWVLLGIMSLQAHAQGSSTQDATGGLRASVHVDFRITIPERLEVLSGPGAEDAAPQFLTNAGPLSVTAGTSTAYVGTTQADAHTLGGPGVGTPTGAPMSRYTVASP
jgi:hypothetical protein